MRIGPLLSLLFIAAAASALWWLETLRDPDPREVADPAEARAPAAYFEAFRASAWDGDGPPRHVIRGERMTQFTAGGESDIERPEIHYRDPHGPVWLVVSDHGRVDAAGEHIELRGRVVATREPHAPEPLVLRTPSLAVLLAAGRAETSDAVDVVSAGTRLQAQGVTATFETGLVELHHHVRGQYEPAVRSR